MTDATTARVTYNPYDYQVHEDPYPTYELLRRTCPVFRNDEFDFWALSRYGDVLGAFRNPGQFSSRFGVSLDPVAYGPHAHKSMSFLALDPPAHTHMRALVSRAFTPKRINLLEDHIRKLTRDYLEGILDGGQFDFVVDFAGRLPMDVISELIGVPGEDRDEVRRLADLLVHRQEDVFDVPPQGIEAGLILAGYFAELISDHQANPRDDLTSGLLGAELDGKMLSVDEIISFLVLMVVAGNETTTKLLANAWYWAWKFPDERAKVMEDPNLIPDWVEETVRFDTSTQTLARVTNDDCTIAGVLVPRNSRVLLLVGSANRDEDVFEGACEYRVTRDNSKLLSFGNGRHFCMGASLARLEAKIALEELLGRVVDYEVDEGRMKRVHSINVRGFARLPTSVTLKGSRLTLGD